MTKEEQARDLVINDGEWPSAEREPEPQARRAAAIQEAIVLLCDAVAELRALLLPVTLLLLALTFATSARADLVVGLSAFAPCCGRCAYLRGCSDDPEYAGACCDDVSYRTFPRDEAPRVHRERHERRDEHHGERRERRGWE